MEEKHFRGQPWTFARNPKYLSFHLSPSTLLSLCSFLGIPKECLFSLHGPTPAKVLFCDGRKNLKGQVRIWTDFPSC